MKKRDIIIIAAVLAVAIIGMIAVNRFAPKGKPAYAWIYVGDNLYEAVALDEDRIITIDQGDGTVNHIEVKNGVVRMADSTCPDKQCVQQGEMSEENYEQRPMRNWIVCLPNQVTIELKMEEEG